jgi:hypothetical protein
MAFPTKWIERQFDFDFPAALYPQLLERLRGTPARLEDRVSRLSRKILVLRRGEAWSIQENAGHLLDLEPLLAGRLDDYEARLPALRAADMSNRKTYEASHNDSDIGEILTAFRNARADIVSVLERWAPEIYTRSALHPRLKKPMRACDVMYFHAEHDDHHLAVISGLIRAFTSAE